MMSTHSGMYLVQQVSAFFRGNATLVDTSGATLVQFALDYCECLHPSYDLPFQNLIIRQLLVDQEVQIWRRPIQLYQVDGVTASPTSSADYGSRRSAPCIDGLYRCSRKTSFGTFLLSDPNLASVSAASF